MLRPRLIPCLLIHNQGLVKTVNFAAPKYVGDPINAVRIFNEKSVDELMVIDIDATVENRGPDYNTVEHLAAECRMPLCYGGGVRTVAQIERLVGLGVEKVALSSILIERPELIDEASGSVGQQSIVAVLDVRRMTDGSYRVFTHNGRVDTGADPVTLARNFVARGAGEIVINSIDRDGAMQGYDTDVIAAVRDAVTVPMTCLGGAGSLADMTDLFDRFGTIGAAAGSLFVFKGVYRAVLINYPVGAAKARVVGGTAAPLGTNGG